MIRQPDFLGAMRQLWWRVYWKQELATWAVIAGLIIVAWETVKYLLR